jgi:hypothetical protein
MALPEFDSRGDLPEGVHPATMGEVLSRFAIGTAQRQRVAARLQRIFDLATSTRQLDRLIVFGSFVTDKPEPNDVDVVLVMRDEFRPKNCPDAARTLFDHVSAEEHLEASIFWIRPSMLIRETLDEFITHWQIKRDLARRGIVEVRP